MRRRRLSDQQVLELKPQASRYALPDPELVGHYIRVAPSGAKTFAAVARDPAGRQHWTTIGRIGHLSIEQAREKAREIISRVTAGQPAIQPSAPVPDSFATVADNWIKRHVVAKGLRTRGEIERCLNRHVLPHWRDRPFAEIKRRDVALLLDQIEDGSGARQADAVLTIIRSMANWYATRDDDYQSPVVKGMKRCTTPARERILDDRELRLIWNAAEQGGQFGALIQMALLTGQRLDKLLDMRWSDVADGTWIVRVEAREKGTGGDLALPEVALAILRRQPRISGTDLVFPPARGNGVMSASQGKKTFEESLPPMERWTIHDCRRTSRSLMSRAGVSRDTAERVLGHVVGNAVTGIYDRHRYVTEKGDALKRLAVLIQTIISGRTATVTPLRARR